MNKINNRVKKKTKYSTIRQQIECKLYECLCDISVKNI